MSKQPKQGEILWRHERCLTVWLKQMVQYMFILLYMWRSTCPVEILQTCILFWIHVLLKSAATSHIHVSIKASRLWQQTSRCFSRRYWHIEMYSNLFGQLQYSPKKDKKNLLNGYQNKNGFDCTVSRKQFKRSIVTIDLHIIGKPSSILTLSRDNCSFTSKWSTQLKFPYGTFSIPDEIYSVKVPRLDKTMELTVFLLSVSYQERHPCIPVLHEICLKTHKYMLNLHAKTAFNGNTKQAT